MEPSNEQCNRMEHIINATTQEKDPRGCRVQDIRKVMNGILWILRTGAPWQDLPLRYPLYQTCHRRFYQWVRQGAFRLIAQELLHRTCASEAELTSAKHLSNGLLCRQKKRSCCWQDKARERRQDHDNCIRFWFSYRRPR